MILLKIILVIIYYNSVFILGFIWRIKNSQDNFTNLGALSCVMRLVSNWPNNFAHTDIL